MADILNESEIENTTKGSQLIDAYSWWYKKRWFFNIIVGIAGLAAILTFNPPLTILDLFGIACWGLLANALYCLGYFIESFYVVKMDSADTSSLRNILFWIGTISYVIASFAVMYEYAYSPDI